MPQRQLYRTCIVIVAGLAGTVACADEDWVTLLNPIETQIRYEIPLEYHPIGSSLCTLSVTKELVEVPAEKQTDGFTHRVTFDQTPDKHRYDIYLRQADEIKVIGYDRQVYRVRATKTGLEGETETVAEGYAFEDPSLSVPFETTGEAIGLPTSGRITGKHQIRIRSLSHNSSSATLTTSLPGSLRGSYLTELAKIDAELTFHDGIAPENGTLKVTVQPFDKKFRYDSGGGPVTEVIQLQSSTLAVQSLARDHSRVLLALIHGSLVAPSYLSLTQKPLESKKPLPPFARIDLIRRELITLEALSEQAGEDGWIVLVFGDLNAQVDQRYRGPQPAGRTLPLEPELIERILGDRTEKKPVLAFVTRSFSVVNLYTQWLGTVPDFYVFSDFSELRKVLPSDPMAYRGPSPSDAGDETLRAQFVIPDESVTVLLVTGQGNLAYIEVNVQSELTRVLTRINQIIRHEVSADDAMKELPPVEIQLQKEVKTPTRTRR